MRNTRVIDIYQDLIEFGLDVTVYDPWIDKTEVKLEYDIDVKKDTSALKDRYSALILAVSHNEFLQLDIDSLKEPRSIVFDIKGFLPKNLIDARL